MHTLCRRGSGLFVLSVRFSLKDHGRSVGEGGRSVRLLRLHWDPLGQYHLGGVHSHPPVILRDGRQLDCAMRHRLSCDIVDRASQDVSAD